MIPLTVATGCGGGDESGAPPLETSTPADPVAVSSATSASSAPSALPKITVLFFGTSLTAGYGLDPGVAFPRLIETIAADAGMPIIAVNAGLSGETSAGAVRRIEWVLRQKADVIVIETGGNDALRALNADSLKTNLRAIVRQAKAAQPQARIVLAVMEAPPNLGASYTARFRQAYVDVAREEDLTLLPFLLDGVAGHPELNQADGVHPNEKGERIVAGNVWRALEPVVAEVHREGSR